MTLEEAKSYLKSHAREIGEKASEGHPLCATIVVLLEIYLEEPDCTEAAGILCMAVEEYRSTYGAGEEFISHDIPYLN